MTDEHGIRVVLLRGVNVSGHRKLAMADFRAMLTDLGFGGVATYIQSGNAVVDGGPADAAGAIETGLAERFGLTDVPIIVRTLDQLLRARATSAEHAPPPTDDDGGAHAKLTHVVFLAAAPPPQRRGSLDADAFGADRFELDIHGGVADLHVSYAVGAGSSKLTTDRIERAYGVSATGRNMNTVARLIDMASA